MSMPLPSLETIKHLLERLKANDVAWFKERYKAGDFLWLKDRLPDGGYEKLGERIEAGDLGWLRERIGGLVGSVPGLDLGAFGITGAKVAAGATAAAAAGAAAAGANRNRGGGSRLWIIPILLFAAILATLLLSKCNKSDADATDAVDTEVVADTTLASDAPAETTPAETTPAETTPADTAVADTTAAAPETTAAETAPATEAPATEVPTTETVPTTEAPPTTVAAVVNAAGDAVSEDLTVYFDNNSSAINAEGQAKIDAAAATLAALPAGTTVNVVGHASAVGDPARNQALSEARASKVVKGLKAKLGDKASNINFVVSAKGDSEPVADLDKSRRVTIEVQK